MKLSLLVGVSHLTIELLFKNCQLKLTLSFFAQNCVYLIKNSLTTRGFQKSAEVSAENPAWGHSVDN